MDLLVRNASFPSDRKTQAPLPIFPGTPHPQRSEQESAPASGEKLGPGAAYENLDLLETMDIHCLRWRARSHSTLRAAPPLRRLAAGAFYSHIFCSIA